MATELDSKLVDKLAGIVKKEPGNSERFYSEKSGIPMGQILRYLVVAELKADPSLKLPATAASAVKGKDEMGLRWPRIAARMGVSEAKAKALYEEKKGTGSAATAYSGRGRRSFASTGTSGRRSSGTSGSKTKSSSKSGTSGRRGATAKAGTASSKKTATSRGKRGTRASASADPK